MKSPRLPNSWRPMLQRFGLALAFATSLPALEITEWKNRQLVRIEQIGLNSLVLSAESFDAARLDLGDLRLLDAEGREVAFVLHHATRPVVQSVAARSFRSTLTSGTTQLTVESGPFPVEEIT